MDLGLKGKVALVVAASKGMGRASAMGFGAEGARVAMCARGEADLRAAADDVSKQTGADVLAVAADANKPEDIERVVARTRDVGGVTYSWPMVTLRQGFHQADDGRTAWKRLGQSTVSGRA